MKKGDAYDGWVREVFHTNPWTLRQRRRSGSGYSSSARLCQRSARTRLHSRLRGGAQRGEKSRIARRGVSRPPTEEKINLNESDERLGLTSSAEIVTVWFVAMAGMMFACIQDEAGMVGKGRVPNLAVGNGREEEDGRRERAEESLSSC